MELFLYYSYCDGVAHLFLRGCGGATFTRNPWPSLAKQSQDYGLMVIIYKLSVHVRSQRQCHTVANRAHGHKTDVNNSRECISHGSWLKTQNRDDL